VARAVAASSLADLTHRRGADQQRTAVPAPLLTEALAELEAAERDLWENVRARALEWQRINPDGCGALARTARASTSALAGRLLPKLGKHRGGRSQQAESWGAALDANLDHAAPAPPRSDEAAAASADEGAAGAAAAAPEHPPTQDAEHADMKAAQRALAAAKHGSSWLGRRAASKSSQQPRSPASWGLPHEPPARQPPPSDQAAPAAAAAGMQQSHAPHGTRGRSQDAQGGSSGLVVDQGAGGAPVAGPHLSPLSPPSLQDAAADRRPAAAYHDSWRLDAQAAFQANLVSRFQVVWAYDAGAGGGGASGLVARGTVPFERIEVVATPELAAAIAPPVDSQATLDTWSQRRRRRRRQQQARQGGLAQRDDSADEADEDEAARPATAAAAALHESSLRSLFTSGRMKLAAKKAQVGSRCWRARPPSRAAAARCPAAA
jgi:hypothetical protein